MVSLNNEDNFVGVLIVCGWGVLCMCECVFITGYWNLEPEPEPHFLPSAPDPADL